MSDCVAALAQAGRLEKFHNAAVGVADQGGSVSEGFALSVADPLGLGQLVVQKRAF